MDTPLTDPEPDRDDPGHAAWQERHDAADTSVDPESHEGRLRRMIHAWRRHQAAPTVSQPGMAAALDAIVAEHDAAGEDPATDAKVAARWQMEKAEKQAEENAKAAEGDEEANVAPTSTLPGAPRETPADAPATPVVSTAPQAPAEPPVPANAAVPPASIPDGAVTAPVAPDATVGAPENPVADAQPSDPSQN